LSDNIEIDFIKQLPDRQQEFNAGVRAIIPLLIGSIPFAIIYGAAAVTSGLSALATAAMSAFVFAGSAQFVAVGMVATGASYWVIVLTTLIVNLRHMLYAATLSPHLKQLSQRWLLFLGFSLTDETFVTSIQRYTQDDGAPHKHWYQFGTALAMYLNWQFFTWIGIWAGRVVPDPSAWGLDFAFPATFIGMLVPLINHRAITACVLCAGIAALLFLHLPNHSGLIVAAFCGVAAGIAVEKFYPMQPIAQEDQAIQATYERADPP
jgi:4-azaleucine resistance transporter AzlC